MPLLHDFTSAIPDTASATKIQPSHWNDAHVLSLKGIAYAPTDDSDVASVSAGQNYFRYLRRKFNTTSVGITSASEEYDFASLPVYHSDDYNFTAQAFVASLTAGITATVTLSPVPLGINGSDVNHYLYLSDGASSEKILITGGTAVSGASSGTITFVPANTHNDGSWTILSATQGIQEAYVVAKAAGRGKIVLPCSGISLYAGVFIDSNCIGIEGQGELNSYITVQTGGWDAITLGSGFATTRACNFLRNFSLNYGGAQTTGWGVKLNGASQSEIQHVKISGMPFGIHVTDSGDVQIRSCDIRGLKDGSAGIGIELTQSATGRTNAVWLDKNKIVAADPTASPDYAALAGIKLSGVGGPYITGNSVVNSGTGLLIDPAANEVIWVFSRGNTFDTGAGSGVQINPSSTGLVRTCMFVHDWTASNGESGFNILQTGASAYVKGVRLVGCESVNNAQHGFLFNNTTTGNTFGIQLVGCIAAGNGTDSVGTYHGIAFGENMKDFSIIGCWSGLYDGFTATQGYGIAILNGCDRYTVQGNQLSGNATGTILVGTVGYVWSVEGNIPETANRYHAVADLASLQVGAKYVDASGFLKVKT
jgi:hypothetical protein